MRQAIGSGQVMVGDDEIDAGRAGAFGGGKGASARVHADHQADARCRGALDHISAQIITFANAVRNVKVRLAAAKLNRGLQDHDRGGAVHVVVPVDQNSFLALDGCVQPFNGRFHAFHEIRRM